MTHAYSYFHITLVLSMETVTDFSTSDRQDRSHLLHLYTSLPGKVARNSWIANMVQCNTSKINIVDHWMGSVGNYYLFANSFEVGIVAEFFLVLYFFLFYFFLWVYLYILYNFLFSNHRFHFLIRFSLFYSFLNLLWLRYIIYDV